MASWNAQILGDHVNLETGFPFKSSEFSAIGPGFRLLRGDNIAQTKLRWTNAKWWTASAEGLEKYFLRKGDVVIAMDRPWIEAGLKHAHISASDEQSLLVQRVARLRANQSINPSFLRYLIGSPDFTNYVLCIQTGTAIPHISATQIRNFQFTMPPLREQERIAGVLGALDDLIDTNEKLCSDLKRLTSTLFRKFLISDGSEGHLGDLISVNSKSGKPSKGATIKYLDIAGLADGQISWPTTETPWNQAPSRARRLAPLGSTLWSMVRPNRRAHALLTREIDNLVVSTGIAVLEPDAIGPSQLFAITDSDEFVDYLCSRAEGSAYPAVSGAVFEQAQVLYLPGEASERFESIAWPMWEQIGVLDSENIALRRTRDELLPLLMSGKIQVHEAEEVISAALKGNG